MNNTLGHAVLNCADYRVRGEEGRNGSGPRPAGWDDEAADRERILRLMGTAESVSFPRFLQTDIPVAENAADAEQCIRLCDAAADVEWCRDLVPFCAAALLGHGAHGEGSPERPRHLKRAERQGRHYTCAFVSSTETLLPLEAVKRDPMAPFLPQFFNEDYEVPFGMKVGCPLVARAWGLQLRKWPFSPALREERPSQWAAWCVLHSQFAQDAAAELLQSLGHGRLWYLPPKLVRGMRAIGLRALVGEWWRLLDRALYAIPEVRWELVDPGATQRPECNVWGAPIYKTGDLVPWEDGLFVCTALSRWPSEAVRGRGDILSGNLSAVTTDQGRGVAPRSFFERDGGVHVQHLGPYEPGAWQREAERDICRSDPMRKVEAAERFPYGVVRYRADHTRFFGPRARDGGIQNMARRVRSNGRDRAEQKAKFGSGFAARHGISRHRRGAHRRGGDGGCRNGSEPRGSKHSERPASSLPPCTTVTTHASETRDSGAVAPTPVQEAAPPSAPVTHDSATGAPVLTLGTVAPAQAPVVEEPVEDAIVPAGISGDTAATVAAVVDDDGGSEPLLAPDASIASARTSISALVEEVAAIDAARVGPLTDDQRAAMQELYQIALECTAGSGSEPRER